MTWQWMLVVITVIICGTICIIVDIYNKPRPK